MLLLLLLTYVSLTSRFDDAPRDTLRRQAAAAALHVTGHLSPSPDNCPYQHCRAEVCPLLRARVYRYRVTV